MAGWGYSDLGGETALAVADAVLPVALELFAVRGDVFAFAVFFVVAVVALVEWTVLPLEFTQALHLASFKCTFVASVFESQLAEPFE